MAVQAKGRLTFSKTVDGRSINFYLDPNMATSQIVMFKATDGKKEYNPHLPQKPLVLTPVMTVSGSSGNKIKGVCTWYANKQKIVSGQGGYTIKNTAPYSLTMANNPATANTLIECEYTYTDSDTGAQQTFKTSVNFTQTENTGATLMARLSKNTHIFRTIEGASENLALKATMVRGADDDTTNVKYEWFILGTNGNWCQITATTAPSGSGLPTGNLFSVPSGSSFTGNGSRTLNISSDAVLNVSTVKVKVTDLDSGSNTYNKSAETTCDLIDLTDPFELKMTATMGSNISESSTGKPMLISVFQRGKAVSVDFYNGKKLIFYRLTGAGAKDTTWAPASSDFTGWTISSGEVSRAFSSGNGTDTNRTVNIKYAHLLPNDRDTTFDGALDF